MREIRIYQSGDYQNDQSLELSPEASQHVAVVLRMHIGEHITLFCGDNREFKATIEAIKKKQVIVRISSVQDFNRESPLLVHLAQAISKGDRMEMVMQKAVELGVASIRPLITDRCMVKLDQERMTKKLHLWQNIVIAACEQSGRNTIPAVHQPQKLEDYLSETIAQFKCVLHPQGNKTWRDFNLKVADIALLVGPEGGLSTDEINLACYHGFEPLTMGPRILRTETAAITALSVLQAVGGDL